MAKPRGATESRYMPMSRCPLCVTVDPQQRAVHQMTLAREGGLDGLRSHLQEEYVALREEGRQRPDLVDDVCHWMANLMEQYSGMVHPETGAPLRWWEARAYMSRMQGPIAEAAGARAPERARFSAGPPAVPGFARVPPTPATPFAEEAAYRGATQIHELDEQDYTPELQEND